MLNNDSKVVELFSHNKIFDILFADNGLHYTYYVIGEMISCIKGRIAFRIALDIYIGTDLTIITANEIAQIDKGIKYCCELLEVRTCIPVDFFPNAKLIMEKEGIEVEDGVHLVTLGASYCLSTCQQGLLQSA